MKNRTIQIILCLLLPWQASSHGENTAGPNGGHIQMPGAFHIELVPVNDHSFKIFLLNMDFKNPTTNDSSVSYHFKNKASVPCIKMNDHFLCELKKGQSLKKKTQISLKATREKQAGNEVSYALPLSQP